LSVRLNKLLAQRGLGARRKCDALIQSGVVRVNGVLVTEPGTQVEPGRDRVLVRGRPLPEPAAPRYYALHKPVGVITTLHDPEGRRTVRELLPPGRRLFPIGRLDADTSGLLLLTDDGELAHHLMHPRYGVEKVYRVWIDRLPDPHQLARLRRGVEFEPGVVSAPARVRVPRPGATDPLLEIALHEGRYRQVRRMCEAVGLGVLRLHRSAYGPLHLGPLERGMCRELSDEEVKLLKAAVARPQSRPRGARQRSYTSGRARRSRPRGEGTPASEALATGPGRREPRGMPSRRELGRVTPRGAETPARREPRGMPSRRKLGRVTPRGDETPARREPRGIPSRRKLGRVTPRGDETPARREPRGKPSRRKLGRVTRRGAEARSRNRRPRRRSGGAPRRRT